MKPTDLREFAEKLYASAHPDADFGKEILDILALQEDSVEAEMIEDLEHHCPEGFHGKDPLKMIEYLGERDGILAAVEEKITDHVPIMRRWGVPARAIADVDYTVDDLLDILEDVELALNAEGLTGNILDMLAELRERKAVPEKPKLEYDL